MTAVRVGLVGAGPWARLAQLPLLTGGDELALTAVWARRPEAAHELADPIGAAVAATLDELFDSCEAVAFAVPPEVQAELALQAVAAGRHVLLDKPVAPTLAGAQRLADALDERGLASLVFFTNHFRPELATFVESTEGATAAQLLNLNGAFLSGPFSQSPWRHRDGELLDWAPHAVDLLMSVLGPVTAAEARPRGDAWAVTLEHGDAGTSQALFSSRWDGEPVRRCDVVTRAGISTLDLQVSDPLAVFAAVRQAFAHAVRSGEAHDCDVHRGVEVQRVIDQLRS